MAQRILLLVISAFILYVPSFHLHNCLISWGLISDTGLIKFLFSLLCNLFWCITANHSWAEITAGSSKYCCDDSLRHYFPVVHRSPYSFCIWRQYCSSGKKKKKEKNTTSKLPASPGCLRFGSCGCIAQLCCSLACGEKEVQEPISEAVWRTFSHSPTSMNISMCLGHQSDWIVTPVWFMWKPRHPLLDSLAWVSVPPSYLAFHSWSFDCFDLRSEFSSAYIHCPDKVKWASLVEDATSFFFFFFCLRQIHFIQ